MLMSHPTIPGEKQEHMSGWKKRRKDRKAKKPSAERIAIREARKKADEEARRLREAEFAVTESFEAKKAPEPTPEPEDTAPERIDFLSDLSDDDLAGYYTELFGEKPHHFKKRETIEREVREKLA